MRHKIEYFLLTAAIAMAAFSFVARQRTLNKLRAGNESLLQQINEQAVPPASVPATRSQSTNAVAQLSPDERRELLRLRGQIQPLRGELQDRSNRVAMLNQPRPRSVTTQAGKTSAEPPPKVQEKIAYMQTEGFKGAQRLADALRVYMAEHAGELPHKLTEVEALAHPSLPEGLSQRFELTRSGMVPEEARPYTFIAREKEPQQLPNGKWVRIYISAKGYASISGPSEPQPDWSEVERLAEARGKQRARKEQRESQR